MHRTNDHQGSKIEHMLKMLQNQGFSMEEINSHVERLNQSETKNRDVVNRCRDTVKSRAEILKKNSPERVKRAKSVVKANQQSRIKARTNKAMADSNKRLFNMKTEDLMKNPTTDELVSRSPSPVQQSVNSSFYHS